jgi:ATP-binding cassette, subfamily B, bacterial PglK
VNKLFEIIWKNITKQDKKKFIFIIFLTIISSFLEVFSIGMVIPFITVLVDPDKLMGFEITRQVISFFKISQSQELITPVAVLFVVITIISAIVRVLTIKVSAEFSFLIGNKLSIRAYELTMRRPFLSHKHMNSSEDISKLASKIDTVIKSLIFPGIMFMSALLMFIFIAVIFLFVNFLLTVSVIFGLLFIYLTVTLYFKQKLKINSYEISNMQNLQIKNIQESLGSIRDIIINNSYKYFRDIYSITDSRLREKQASNIIVAQAPRYFIETLSVVFISMLAYYFIHVSSYIEKEMIFPVFITIALVLQKVLPIAQQAYRSWASIEGNKKALNDVFNVLNTPPNIIVKKINKSLIFDKEININNLSFKYPNSNMILENISFTIKKGEKIGFIGGTGSGKSTLIDIIMGLLNPSSGEIIVDGEKLKDENLLSWYKKISHVPQNIYILDNDFFKNIAFGSDAKQIDKLKVQKVAKLSCISEFIDKKENGYNESVGEGGSKISGGQKQRIGIARCLYKDASILVFDEATSALDNKTEEKIMGNVYNFDKNKTILIIAHRLSTLKGCDKIVELENGRIKRIGTYSEIIKE